MPVKYDKDHKANPGFTADKDKVAALYAKTDALHASKGRVTAPAPAAQEEQPQRRQRT